MGEGLQIRSTEWVPQRDTLWLLRAWAQPEPQRCPPEAGTDTPESSVGIGEFLELVSAQVFPGSSFLLLLSSLPLPSFSTPPPVSVSAPSFSFPPNSFSSSPFLPSLLLSFLLSPSPPSWLSLWFSDSFLSNSLGRTAVVDHLNALVDSGPNRVTSCHLHPDPEPPTVTGSHTVHVPSSSSPTSQLEEPWVPLLRDTAVLLALGSMARTGVCRECCLPHSLASAHWL